MGWFKKEEENFDDSAAYESDKYATLKVVLMIIFGTAVVVFIAWGAYNQYQKFVVNNNNTDLNQSNITINNDTGPGKGKVVVNFTDFNLTVDENPEGLYYYTTQEKVVGENCYIDDVKKSCSSLTNSVCSEKECRKDLVIETECFVNNKKIDCPE